MSLFTKLFPRQSVNLATDGYLNMLTGYAPSFSSFDGGVYEAALCRSAIHTFATQCSKLDLKTVGTSNKYEKLLTAKPNLWQTPSQFLYQVATILECQSTCFIFPELDPMGKEIQHIYAINPTQASVVKDKRGTYWLNAVLPTGESGYVELERVGILTKHQYRSLFFGTKDNPLEPTLNLIKAQEDGIIEGVKSSASIRFMAKLAQTLKASDIEEERKRFVRSNLSSSNNGGVLMFDTKYEDVKQINSTPFIVDGDQMALINENVFMYFGTNKAIIENNFTDESWSAYYEGKIEPFAIQLSQVLTNMLYTERELGFGNYVIASANKLQYASNDTKIELVTQLFDRGMMTQNMGFDIFNMPRIGEEGDKFYIRLEYVEVSKLNNEEGDKNE